jgi:hypothetical protein
MRTLLLFIYCAFIGQCYPQAKPYAPKVMLAVETYAFLKGQSAALKKVALQFPSLKEDVRKLQNSSKVIFGALAGILSIFWQENWAVQNLNQYSAE